MTHSAAQVGLIKRWYPHGFSLLVAIILIFLFQSNTSGQNQTGPLAKNFEGCYDLKLGRWWPWSFGEENYLVTPPDRIKLLSERGTKGLEKDAFLIRAMPSPKGEASHRSGPSYWEVRSKAEVDLIWNDGFTGVTLALTKRGDRLEGWAHPFFDAPKFIPRIAHVKAQKIACETPK